MASVRGVFLSPGIVAGLYAINTYRFLTTAQFARVANISYYYAGEVLRALEGRGCLGYFGSVGIPGQGKPPKSIS
jgi:hypothetical protein